MRRPSRRRGREARAAGSAIVGNRRHALMHVDERAVSLSLDALEERAAPSAEGRRELDWVENRPSSGWLPRIDFRELWSYRDLVHVLASRDLKLRYKQTAFGVSWALLRPLAAMGVFTVLFGRFVGVPSEGVPYAVFVLAGLTLWFYVASSVEASAESLVEHRELVTKVYVPRILAPLAAVVPGLLDLAVGATMLAVVMAAYGVVPGGAVVLLPLWVVLATAVATGVGLWLAALNALYRDVRYALGFLLQLWFFASPVVFPSSVVEGGWRYALALNPMAGVLDGFRWSLLQTPAPGAEALVSSGVTVLVVLGGLVYFRRMERRLADRI